VAGYLKDATAEIARAREKNKEVEALRATAFGHFDGSRRDEAEEAWARVLVESSATSHAYARAAQALESALGLDGTRKDIRRTLGDILFERVLLAERDHQANQLDELRQRLSVYDEGGERTARLDAPAVVTVTTSPVPARIILERYIEEGAHIKAEVIRAVEPTQATTLELSPGSYLLTLTAPAKHEVRYPLYIHRGERLDVSIELPEAGSIPRGFVYIPEGRFMFGTSAEEAIRAFLDTAPIHVARTGPYLISATETTYADWIEYLSAIPPEQREALDRRFSHYRGSTELSQLPDGRWRITIQPAGQVYTAVSGETITYRTRSVRATQDWLRFPISGVSIADIEGYTRWLDSSGRVPGARLCTELEWERAARGADEREFPHGNQISPNEANFDLTYGREPGGFGPDEVGSHPKSRSPFGLDDMAGNVWEWTRATLNSGGYVMRGGSFYQYNTVNRSTNREGNEPTMRDITLGVRICAPHNAR
ncbi:MAG: formylglycine-generating enzyme family protein, partial [Polyangiaceae bacterium]|nr:formylglycine-generating enzyme family protein [Polyangiaceae bacterium]